MAKTVIFFVRHGEVDNLKKILYGRLPGFRLTEKGREQVKNTALKLKNFPVKIIYTSPLLRARESARIISGHFNLKPVVSYSLIEIGSIFEGISLKEYKEKIQPFQFDEKNVKKGHESIKQIRERMFKFLNAIKKRHTGKHIIVISHGDPIAVLKSVLDKKNFSWDYKKSNYLNTGDFIRFDLE